jgi:hypothetical protein
VTIKSGTSENASINQDNWKVTWSDFTLMKSDMVEHTCKYLSRLKSHNTPVQYIRLDPAGENKKLAKCTGSSDWAVLEPLYVEFTSQDTPQHNSLSKLACPYLVIMMNAIGRRKGT